MNIRIATTPIAILALVTTAHSQSMRPTHLRTEYLENPIGIGETSPRMSWWCESKERGDKQTAYQILVASSSEKLRNNQADLWNTGKIKSDETTQIAYDGKKLTSRTQCWWKVRVWDRAGKPSTYSKPATWEIGLLDRSDWKGKWIGIPSPRLPNITLHGRNWIWYPEGNPAVDAPLAPRYFRATFDLKNISSIKTIELCGFVDDEAIVYLNGKEIGPIHGFKSIAILPLTRAAREGKNVLAVHAWNTGGPAGFSMFVHVIRSDGENGAFARSDTSWRASTTADQGWNTLDFDDKVWSRAMIVGIVGQGAWPEPHLALPLDKATYVRKDFQVGSKTTRARVYASARGVYELYIDGKKVGKDFFAPGWTDYTKRIQYQAYDVTALLMPGRHTIGAVVGDGWYVGSVGWGGRGQYGNQPSVLIQLEIEGKNGRQVIASDASWHANTGPILSSDIMLGESYDARKELRNWCDTGAATSGWQPVHTEPLGSVPLVWQPDLSVQQWNELQPKKITEPKRGVYVFDLGQNMVGWARLKVRGERGKKVQLRFAEVLNPDGTIYTENLRGAKATDTYILKGGGTETYEPSFTFHGFRYVEVTGYPGKPTKAAIKGIVVGSALTDTGSFECSNAMVNQLQHNIYWGMRGNYLTIPTDCPQRDERLGWMGDAEIFTPTATFNCDVAPFMTKWLHDVQDGQSAAGAFADVSPRILVGDGAPAWGDAGVIVPWSIYQAYGDKRLLARSYPSMKAWVEYILASNRNLLWENSRNNDYGDWLSIKADTPKDVLATAFFAHSTDLVAKSAEALGNTVEARKYRVLFEGIKAAFNKAYVSPSGRIKGDTQTCYALALAFNLLPNNLRKDAVAYLANDIEYNHSGHLSTGFVGVKYLAPMLADNGRLDLAYKLLLNDTFPSWGYSIKQGATTIWERWDGYTKEKGFQDPGMNSFNHYSFGSIGEWMYSGVGGLTMTSPGWKTFRVNPLIWGIAWAKTGFDSPHGHIQCDWQFYDDDIVLDVNVPVNSQAEVWVLDSNKILLNGADTSSSRDLKLIRTDATGFKVFEVGGGKYRFESLLHAP